MSGAGREAPGVVRVRLSGAHAEVAKVAAFLDGLATEDPAAVLAGLRAGLEVIDCSVPRANRREPGERVYLTLLVTNGARK